MHKLYLNFLSFLSVAFSFAFNIYLGRKFNLSSNLDLFFASSSLTVYFGCFVQVFYESFAPYYAELTVKSKEESDKFYSVLLNQTLLAALFIIVLLEILSGVITRYFFKSEIAESFFRVFILSLAFQNMDQINKGILNMKFKFAMYYISSIAYSTLNLILIYMLSPEYGVMSLAYACIISYCIVLIVEAVYLKKSLGIRYYLVFYHEKTLDIIKGSLWVKAGSLLYGSKDIIISKLLLEMGPGINSIYSYALKFANALYSIINAPSINIYTSEITYRVSQGKLKDISEYNKKTIKQLFILYIPSVVLVSICIPKFLEISMKLEKAVTINIRNTFLLLSIFCLIVIVDACYAKIVTAFKRFDLTFWINCTFFVSFIITVFILKSNVVNLIVSMCIAQLFNVFMYMFFAANLLRKGSESRYEVFNYHSNV